MEVILVAGARPNFMKVAPIIGAIHRHNETSLTGKNHVKPVLVHTGQHYDYEMSQVFFQDLELPQPDIYLGVGSGSHAEQTGRVMVELEKVLQARCPDLVLVVGDVNSTLGAALAAVKLSIPVAHVEAGLRSNDKSMPEEINRKLTDLIADYLFTPSPDAGDNLRKEGIGEEKIFLVGNVMVDSLLHNREKAKASEILPRLSLAEGKYAILTLHRPGNVDAAGGLTRILEALEVITREIPVIFPIHGRTRKNIDRFGLGQRFAELNAKKGLTIVDPLGYLDFLCLMMNTRLVMTDSGGIQEEATVLDIPCLTLRDNTERPITISQGTNILVGSNTEKIIAEVFNILQGRGKRGTCPELWDGKTSERIVSILFDKIRE